MAERTTDLVVEVEQHPSSSGRTISRSGETSTPEPRRLIQLVAPAPEKKLNLFALRLAVLEKIATRLGSLGFVWATVVLLGGFVGSLETSDFWFVTVILVVEGSRTFSRSHELELPHSSKYTVSRINLSSVFYWLQIASAFASIVTSMFKLIKQDYRSNDLKPTNFYSALTLFYSISLAAPLIFLVEKNAVSTDLVKRFFYDAYSRCLHGNIFDGLKIGMAIFAMEILVSNSPDEQLTGANILSRFSTNQDYSVDTLQKIGTNLEIVERLLEMLNWRNQNQQVVRRSAAEILSRLASKKQNSLRVAGIPGAIESIYSLLQTTGDSGQAMDDQSNLWTLISLGLLILKRLARDHDNCGKIGKTKGLLSKIIDFTYADKMLLEESVARPIQIMLVKRSLKLLKNLVTTTGATGKNLRRDISANVFTVSNIRETLHHGKSQPDLQKLGAEILTSLAFDEGAAEKIGGTGGVLKALLCIFLNNELPVGKSGVRVSAGESIAMLAQGSKSNCQRILRSNVLQRLVEALDNPLIRLNAARILRNLCAYTAPDQFNEKLKEVIKSAGATVLMAIKYEEGKPQEVMLGLAPHILKLMSTPEELRGIFEEAGVTEEELAKALTNILKKYEQPVPKVPRIRRFAIELTIAMMKANPETVKTFQNLEMKNELETVFETAAELENFDIFSGTVGLASHGSTINELIEEAMLLLS
ncbi:hypothetical protein ARALYDRAFT_915454 [Arabidopsis lyrata subsp. lyrata]|uniref:Binding protein n=1 Tax=Arabidopsis lyrata subsp. lyrata TaxID=81972 RepID=D7MH43_ARALL|nr:hypothetical protein ARALYDRAFT_915454 [Arabidopsis lyrata subsp. lyrata]